MVSVIDKRRDGFTREEIIRNVHHHIVQYEYTAASNDVSAEQFEWNKVSVLCLIQYQDPNSSNHHIYISDDITQSHSSNEC